MAADILFERVVDLNSNWRSGRTMVEAKEAGLV
jgi:hypothetical protein